MDFDKEDALQRVAGDAAHLKQLISLFTKIYPPSAEKISHAIATLNFSAVESESHGLAGSLSNLGAKRAARAANALSVAAKNNNRESALQHAQELSVAIKSFIERASDE